MNKQTGVIILAAGRGKRMQSDQVNKVALPVGNRPLIRHSVDIVSQLPIAAIVVVVGFAKASVMEALKDTKVLFADQSEQLGTAHAVSSGLRALPKEVTDVLVIQGDDSAFYPIELLTSLITAHQTTNAAITFLTIEMEDPSGLGRIVRDAEGDVIGVVEEKDATEEQKLIREVNPACYVFSVAFLQKYLDKIEKSPVTGEYYLTSLIDIAIQYGEQIHAVSGGKLPWRGVNTKEELVEAEQLLQQL